MRRRHGQLADQRARWPRHPWLCRVSASLLLVVILVQMLLAFTASPAAAGGLSGALDGFLDNWEGQMTVTYPGFYEGQKRGYLSGGALRLRFPNISPQPMALQLPSLKAGCGGINFFGGSFSFINTDRFTEYLQAIAQNAAGMAFNMALTTLCPQCASVLKGLEDIARQVNASMGSSCQVARSLLKTTASQGVMNAVRYEACSGINAATGAFQDWFGGKYECQQNGNAVWNANEAIKDKEAADGKPPEEPSQKLVQNIFWEAWIGVGVGLSQDQADFEALGEQMMSLYGTVVLSFDGNKKQHVARKVPTIEVTEMLNGWEADKKIWTCTDNYVDCLKVEERDVPTSYKGLIDTIYEKVQLYKVDLQARTRAVVDTVYLQTPVAGVPLYRLIVNAAEVEAVQQAIIDKGSRWVALELLGSWTKQIEQQIYSQIHRLDDKGLSASFNEEFLRRRQEIAVKLAEERTKISQEIADLSGIIQMVNNGSTKTMSSFVKQVFFATILRNNSGTVSRE